MQAIGGSMIVRGGEVGTHSQNGYCIASLNCHRQPLEKVGHDQRALLARSLPETVTEVP